MTSIGVVIPTRDREQLLRRALASVEGADQVVVVDDGSTTYPPSLAEELRSRGIEYVRLESSRGPCFARNQAIARVRTDLILFLDDDDFVLDGGLERIRAVADAHPGHVLYLHNCRFSTGGASIDESSEVRKLSFEDWVALFVGGKRAEFKPVAGRSVFEHDGFDDTGASGEGLLWARVVKAHGALLSHLPVVYYDVDDTRTRLTSRSELLARADANARIASAWVAAVGPTVRRVSPATWRGLVIRTGAYSAVAGKRYRPPPDLKLGPFLRVALWLIGRLPKSLILLGFRSQRARRRPASPIESEATHRTQVETSAP